MLHKIAIKDLKEMLKERTFITVVILLLFIASFSSVLTLGLLILYNPEAVGYTPTVRIAVVGNCNISGECLTPETAVSYFNTGEVDALVILEKMGNKKIYARIILPENEIKAIQALLYIKKELIKYEKELQKQNGIPEFSMKVLVDGKEIEVPEGVSIVFRFIYLILIPLLAITTAVIAAGMTIDSICEEIENGTVELLLISPAGKRLGLGKILAPFVLSSILIPVYLALLLINRIDISNLPEVYVSSLSLSGLFISLAYAISVYFGDRERTQLIFSIIAAGSLPLLISKTYSPAVVAGRLAAGSPVEPAALILILVFLISPFLISELLKIEPGTGIHTSRT